MSYMPQNIVEQAYMTNNSAESEGKKRDANLLVNFPV